MLKRHTTQWNRPMYTRVWKFMQIYCKVLFFYTHTHVKFSLKSCSPETCASFSRGNCHLKYESYSTHMDVVLWKFGMKENVDLNICIWPVLYKFWQSYMDMQQFVNR